MSAYTGYGPGDERTWSANLGHPLDPRNDADDYDDVLEDEMSDMQRLLERFVANNSESRIYLRSVVAEGDHFFASNGHIIVRVPKCDGVQAVENADSRTWAALFERLRLTDGFADLPVLPYAERCPACNGTGVAYKCPDCDGEGEYRYGGHVYDCQECNRSGQVDDGSVAQACIVCYGSGEKPYQRIPIGNTGFDLRYLKRISDLPGLKFATNPDDPDAAAYFVWDGGEGLLMPLRA